MKELLEVQSELKCPKGNFNSFGKYKYRSAEQILEAVKPLLLKAKCTLTIKDEVFELGNVHVLKATAIFSNGTDKIEVTGLAGIDYNMKGMSVPQMYGSSSSYARKYALNGLFLIDETEQDADSKQPEKEVKMMTKDQIEFLEKIISSGQITVDKQEAISKWIGAPQTYQNAAIMIEKIRKLTN